MPAGFRHICKVPDMASGCLTREIVAFSGRPLIIWGVVQNEKKKKFVRQVAEKKSIQPRLQARASPFGC